MAMREIFPMRELSADEVLQFGAQMELFNEDLHPRADDGKFATKPGGGGGGASAKGKFSKQKEKYWADVAAKSGYANEEQAADAAAAAGPGSHAHEPGFDVLRKHSEQIGNEMRAGRGLAPVEWESVAVPVSSLIPSQTGDDYENESSRLLSKFVGKFNSSDRDPEDDDPGNLDYAPAVVDENGVIMDGNHRHAARTMAGLKMMDVVRPKAGSKRDEAALEAYTKANLEMDAKRRALGGPAKQTPAVAKATAEVDRLKSLVDEGKAGLAEAGGIPHYPPVGGGLKDPGGDPDAAALYKKEQRSARKKAEAEKAVADFWSGKTQPETWAKPMGGPGNRAEIEKQKNAKAIKEGEMAQYKKYLRERDAAAAPAAKDTLLKNSGGAPVSGKEAIAIMRQADAEVGPLQQKRGLAAKAQASGGALLDARAGGAGAASGKSNLAANMEAYKRARDLRSRSAEQGSISGKSKEQLQDEAWGDPDKLAREAEAESSWVPPAAKKGSGGGMGMHPDDAAEQRKMTRDRQLGRGEFNKNKQAAAPAQSKSAGLLDKVDVDRKRRGLVSYSPEITAVAMSAIDLASGDPAKALDGIYKRALADRSKTGMVRPFSAQERTLIRVLKDAVAFHSGPTSHSGYAEQKQKDHVPKRSL
jgi:hypothetical protein